MTTAVINAPTQPRLILDLNDLWAHVEELTRAADPHGTLPPVMGGGQTRRPRLAFVFINPTIRNASTREGWNGPRLPFIGTRAVWRVFAGAGLLPETLVEAIAARPKWDETFAEHVYAVVRAHGLYLTNLVKWTGPNGDLPSTHLIHTYSGVLKRELELVQPQAVVAFGGMTHRALTGSTVRLADILAHLRTTGTVPSTHASGLGLRVYPCYFPVGRGNPRAAVEILAALASERRWRPEKRAPK